MDNVNTILLNEEDAPQRIDNYLFRRCKGVPKSHIYKLLRSGQIRVNKKRVKADYRLSVGDILRLPSLRIATTPPVIRRTLPLITFEIIFEDEAIVVINKPAKMAVHGGSGISLGLIETLRLQRPKACFLELVHRLDRDTSGLLLVAKKRSALTKLHDSLRMGTVHKRYQALILGKWLALKPHKWLSINTPLIKYFDDKGERRVRPLNLGQTSLLAKPTHTQVRLMHLYADFTLVEVNLKTGRTHQIRVHLASQGYPILGDEKYGDFAINHMVSRGKQKPLPPLKQMFLHAASLSFSHPLNQKAMHFFADIPQPCQNFLAALSFASTS